MEYKNLEELHELVELSNNGKTLDITSKNQKVIYASLMTFFMKDLLSSPEKDSGSDKDSNIAIKSKLNRIKF